MPEILAEFAAFVRDPAPIVPEPLRAPGGWRRLGLMTMVYCAGLAVLGLALAAWQRALALPAPEAFGKFAPATLAPLVVLVAPVIEETLFRGWLRGRPRALWLLALALLAGGLLTAVVQHWHDQIATLGVLALVLAAPIGWFALRRRATPAWYRRQFRWWFTGAVAVFALAHLANYPRVTPALLPMVLPQVWAGLVFGYLRMRHGLGASILAHAAGNAAALATALLGA